MEIDLRHAVRIARRWWWLLLLAPLVAGTSAYIAGDRQQDVYSATAMLRVSPGAGGTSDFNAIQASQSLTETYRLLIQTEPVLQRVIDERNLSYSVDELQDFVTVSTIQDTQLIEVSVSSPDPAQAALIANTIATEFESYVAEVAAAEISQTRGAIEQEIRQTGDELAQADEQLGVLEAAADANDPAVRRQITSLSADRERLAREWTELQLIDRSIVVDIAGKQTKVAVAERAVLPEVPYAPRVRRSAALGVAAGLLIALGAVGLITYLDTSVKVDSDFVVLTGAPLLAAIATDPKLRTGKEQLFASSRPNSPPAEAVRLLRTNMEFANAAKRINTLVITSPGHAEGKSTVTANLGIAMAQAGFATVIIDADLRRPSQHHYFGLREGPGLTTLLTHPHYSWDRGAVRLTIPNLTLVPSGPLPPNPADLLSLDRLSDLLAEIAKEADIILIDTPPVLAVSDPLAVARKTDGVMLVCRAGHTRTEALTDAARAFQQGDIRVIGVVLNQLRRNEGPGHHYYSDTYPEKATPSTRSKAAQPALRRVGVTDNGTE